MIRKMPAAGELLPEGDFRSWAEIDAWARQIVGELARETSRSGGQQSL